MIVECIACHARFSVPDAQIPVGGRTVRCGRCAHEWHVEPPIPEPVADALMEPPAAGDDVSARDDAPAADVAPVDESDDFLNQLNAAIEQASGAGPKKPVATKGPSAARKPRNVKPFKMAAAAIAALWLILAFITYFPRWMEIPGLSGIYHGIGVHPTDGLVFSDVTMERAQDGPKTKFILSGSIRNHSNMARSVPAVRVVLRDKTDASIWGREYPVHAELKAGEVYPFRITNVETVFASNVSTIVVDMGNSLQLLVR